jgi:hypothetical protein
MHFTKPQLTHPDAPSQNAPQPPRLPPTGPRRRRRRRAAGSELHVLRRPRLPLASAEERLLGVPDAHGGPGPRARPTGPRRRLGRRGGGVPAVQEARARAVGAPRAQGGRRVRRRRARRRRGLRQRDGTGRAGVLSVCVCVASLGSPRGVSNGSAFLCPAVGARGGRELRHLRGVARRRQLHRGRGGDYRGAAELSPLYFAEYGFGVKFMLK